MSGHHEHHGVPGAKRAFPHKLLHLWERRVLVVPGG
jgi:hypothetical protein